MCPYPGPSTLLKTSCSPTRSPSIPTDRRPRPQTGSLYNLHPSLSPLSRLPGAGICSPCDDHASSSPLPLSPVSNVPHFGSMSPLGSTVPLALCSRLRRCIRAGYTVPVARHKAHGARRKAERALPVPSVRLSGAARPTAAYRDQALRLSATVGQAEPWAKPSRGPSRAVGQAEPWAKPSRGPSRAVGEAGTWMGHGSSIETES